MALLDVSTGEFTTAEYHGADGRQALADELAILQPREIVVPDGFEDAAALVAEVRINARVTAAAGWTFDQESARRTLLEQLRAQSLLGFGLEDRPAAVRAAGALVHYLRDTQKADLAHVREVAFRAGADCLLVDATTLRNLEVIDAADGGRTGSLLHELDRTMTSMGGRLLRGWLLRPLVALERIQDRLDAVEELAFRSTERAKLRETLKTIHDVERLVARASLGIAGPRDLVALRQSIATVPRVRMLLSELQAPLVSSLVAELDDCADLRDELDRTLLEEPPAVARDGGVIRDGVDAELDELRTISRSNKQHIAAMEDAERTRTGISSLKIRYNRVFGYYIEISKSNLGNVPPDYHRKQTIAGGERFITPALKEYEEKVLGADERCLELEIAIFERLRARVAADAPRIQETARGLAALDVLAALAETAATGNYTKPMMHAGDDLVAVDVRHPVVERHVWAGGRLRAQRCHARRRRAPAHRADRAEHGRQVDVSAPDGAPLPDGPGRLLRAGAQRQAAGRRSHLRPRRRLRQHRARPVDLHGRDAGDREHPAQRDVAQPAHPRRDRPRHVDVRRLEPGLGRRRASGLEPARAAEDHLRDPLSRAHGSGRRAPQRHQLPRRRARVAGRHRVSAQGRAGTIRSQLRHPGGAARRPAAARRGARARDPQRPRARRAVARRPSLNAASLNPARPGSPRATMRAVSSVSSRRRRRLKIRSSGGSRRSTSTI